VNLGSPIELFLLAMFVGGGAFAGDAIGGIPGAVIGGVTGFVVRLGLGILIDRLALPSCSCGSETPHGFDVDERAPAEFDYRCRRCGKAYELSRGLWSERLDDGTVTPRMRRGFLGVWRVL
jgi:hypothetical protein